MPFAGWPAALREDAERSWEHIVEVEACDEDEYWQATVEEVFAVDVVGAVRPVVLRWSLRDSRR